MICLPLSPWITIRGASTVLTITQSDGQYLDLRGFEDIVGWLDVREVNNGSGGTTNVAFIYQTSCTKDETLFTNVAAPILLNTGLTVTKMLMSSTSVPLGRWLRYQLNNQGAPTGAWDVCFRVWIAANVPPRAAKLAAAAMGMTPPPPRANGKSCNGDCQKGGSRPVAPPQSTLGTPGLAGTVAGQRLRSGPNVGGANIKGP